MTKDKLAEHMNRVFESCRITRGEGQKEYAHDTGNAFRNFEALSKDLRHADSDVFVTRKAVLWIYLKKHLDGILAYINGHESQRESVHGRIKDAIVYLVLLDGMVTQDEAKVSKAQTVPIPGSEAEFLLEAEAREVTRKLVTLDRKLVILDPSQLPMSSLDYQDRPYTPGVR